jgi:hypothetical protein
MNREADSYSDIFSGSFANMLITHLLVLFFLITSSHNIDLFPFFKKVSFWECVFFGYPFAFSTYGIACFVHFFAVLSTTIQKREGFPD